MANTKLAAIWTRTSTDGQSELSHDSQESAARRALETHGYEVLPHPVLKWTGPRLT